ncbi:MAG: hypothetical protein IPO77_06125 [Acidobacteria bacterium]|nr:hypothetical protein [Acidobacteriota bacterium]
MRKDPSILLKQSDFAVKTVFYRQERQEGQERQNGNSLNVLFPAKMSNMGQLLNPPTPPHLFFGVLGVLGDKNQVISTNRDSQFQPESDFPQRSFRFQNLTNPEADITVDFLFISSSAEQ